MAVKFSEFSQKQLVTDVTNVVGYLTAGELNIMIPPANLDTTYVVSTGNAGASPTINLQGTKPNQPAITPSTVSLTGSGATLLAGNGSTTIDFASTAYALTSTDTSPAGTVPLVLTGTSGADVGTDTVSLVGTGTVGITSSGNTITINGTGGGGGSVTNVSSASNASALTLVTTSPTSTPVVTLGVTGGSAGQFLNYLGDWATPAGGGGSGTVTNVDSAVTAIPGLTLVTTDQATTPTVTLGLAGTAGANEYLDGGTGQWTALPASTNTTYTVDVPAGTTSINLKGSDATDDPIILVGGTDIGLVRDSANQITINSQAVGGVTSVDEKVAGISTGIPIIVSPTTGTVEIQSMAFSGAAKVGHVPSSDAAGQTTDFLRADGTWATPASAGISIDKQTFTGNGTLTDFTLTTAAGCTADNLNIYISGVYQNSVDASNAVTYTVGSGLDPILQFVSAGTATAPPVTATRGIEVVITR